MLADVEKQVAEDGLQPSTMGFMFEIRSVIRPIAPARSATHREHDYRVFWSGSRDNSVPPEG